MKKLIEVALPLDEINAACKADKDRKTGTIRNLHKWFAPMPLPAWRALLFAALVDDPEDDNQRVYLLDLIKRLVSNGADLPDEKDLAEAKAILHRNYPDGLPVVLDPFCGGGSTLVEALRLGLPAYGSDLNSVPTLISRTLVEVLPAARNGQPVSKRRTGREELLDIDQVYSELDGLAVDVSRYAQELKEELLQRLRAWFPVEPSGHPIAWLWVRTAKCQNPVCGIETPLATSWWLSKKPGDFAWIDPNVTGDHVEFTVISGQRAGSAPEPPKLGRANFRCLRCGGTVTSEHLRTQAAESSLGLRMTAVVVGRPDGSRIYREASASDEAAGLKTLDDGTPPGLDIPLTDDPRSIWCVPYGIRTQADLYGPRQLAVLTILSELVTEVERLGSTVADPR
jgi:putative DNA methylase